MGILVRPEDRRRAELEEIHSALLSCAAMQRRKHGGIGLLGRRLPMSGEESEHDRIVCITSGVSYLGAAVVKQLLLHGYHVRLILDNEEDMEKLRDMQMSEDMRGINDLVEVVTANLTDGESVYEAIDGCHALFHTAAFIDPAGVSGYSKSMAELESKVSQSVVRACATSPSVRKCVFTSSLLACIWQHRRSDNRAEVVVDHRSWSDESYCINRKLWYALGKLRAEKIAWRIAKEEGLKLSTICPALISGPEFYRRNPTSSIAYLKGGQEMYENGLLATVDVNKLAEAHIRVLEEMNKAVFGRYTCFDQIISNQDQVQKLTEETEMDTSMLFGRISNNNPITFKLSNAKLAQLMSTTHRCTDDLARNSFHYC